MLNDSCVNQKMGPDDFVFFPVKDAVSSNSSDIWTNLGHFYAIPSKNQTLIPVIPIF